MKLPPGVLEDNCLRIDYTGFSKIRECHRKAWHELAWRRILGGWDPAKGFGAAIHAGLDVRQKALMEGRQLNPAKIEVALEKAFQGVQVEEDDHRTLGRAKEVLALYCELWKNDGEDFEVVASEQAKEKELGVVTWQLTSPPVLEWMSKSVVTNHTCKVIWQGRADELVRDRRTGKRAVKDTKTSSRLYDLDKKWKEFKQSPQWRMYCWLFSEPGAEILDAVLDLIVVRPPLKKPSPKSDPRTEFHRLPLSYTPELLAETRRDILKEIAAWLTACGHYAEPPSMTGAPLECTWTQRGCPYLSVCTNGTEKERMSWLLGGGYVDNVWDAMATEEA